MKDRKETQITKQREKNHFRVYGDRTYNEFENYADKQRFGIRLNYQFNATKNKYKGKGAGESEKGRL